MYSLSFNKGKKSVPVAIATGGEFNGEIVYLHDGEQKDNEKMPKKEINFRKYENDMKFLKPRERIQAHIKLQEALDKNIDPNSLIGLDNKLKSLYEKIRLDATDKKCIEVPMNSYFSILPTMFKDKREIFYNAGASGSGKSYLARALAENYKKIWGDKREVYLISKLKEDATLDNAKCKIKRIDIETFVTDPPQFEEFNNSLVLFDDYDTMDAPLDKTVEKLINDIAIMGRHGHISMACMTHHLTNYKKTRLLLNEATHIVIYPHGSSFSAISYLLKTNVGMDLKDIKEIKHISSRWVLFSKNYPPFMISEHMVKLLN